jgi:hypothetical protein
MRDRRSSVHTVVASCAYVVATILMYAGVGTSFLPSATKEEGSEVWRIFFFIWTLALVALSITRFFMPRARSGPKCRSPCWMEVGIGVQALICALFLLLGNIIVDSRPLGFAEARAPHSGYWLLAAGY